MCVLRRIRCTHECRTHGAREPAPKVPKTTIFDPNFRIFWSTAPTEDQFHNRTTRIKVRTMYEDHFWKKKLGGQMCRFATKAFSRGPIRHMMTSSVLDHQCSEGNTLLFDLIPRLYRFSRVLNTIGILPNHKNVPSRGSVASGQGSWNPRVPKVKSRKCAVFWPYSAVI